MNLTVTRRRQGHVLILANRNDGGALSPQTTLAPAANSNAEVSRLVIFNDKRSKGDGFVDHLEVDEGIVDQSPKIICLLHGIASSNKYKAKTDVIQWAIIQGGLPPVMTMSV